MAIIVWNESLSVGVTEFDNQHKKLVGYINQLHDAMSQGKGRDVLLDILNGLAAYTQSHFTAEEKLMEKHGYPGYEHHKAEHIALINQVSDYIQKYQAGQLAIAVDLRKFLKEWLMHHILECDKRYSAFFKEKGIV